jgi:hypothetical protein
MQVWVPSGGTVLVICVLRNITLSKTTGRTVIQQISLYRKNTSRVFQHIVLRRVKIMVHEKKKNTNARLAKIVAKEENKQEKKNKQTESTEPDNNVKMWHLRTVTRHVKMFILSTFFKFKYE